MADAEVADALEINLSKQNPKLKNLPVVDTAVTTLDANENELTALPPEIGTLSKLRVLNVSDNMIAALPDEIGDCEALEELLLYKNQLKKLPAGCGRLKALKILVRRSPLGNHELAQCTTLVIDRARLISYRSLRVPQNVFNNKLMSFPAALGLCTQLEEVNAAANKLALLSDESLKGWSSLRVLNLYDNNLVQVGSLGQLTSLIELRVYNNNLEVLPELPAICPLELLEANNNRLKSIDDAYFSSTPRLRRLVLAGNTMTALPGSLARNCSRLQFLQVGGNQIRSISMEPRRCVGFDSDDDGSDGLCWPELETIFVENNPLDALPAELVNCTKLLRCNLSGTQLDEGDVTASTILKLVLARPGGSFWTVKGRRWVSDEAKQASFIQERAMTRMLQQQSKEPEAEAEAEADADADADAEEEEEGSICMTCDNCGKELVGDDAVWQTADGDFSAECWAKLGADAGDGKWTTAAVRIAEEMSTQTGERGEGGEKSGGDAPSSPDVTPPSPGVGVASPPLLPPVVAAAEDERRRRASGEVELMATDDPAANASEEARVARATAEAAAAKQANEQEAEALLKSAADIAAEEEALRELARSQLEQAAETADAELVLHELGALPPPSPAPLASTLARRRPWWADAPCCGTRPHGGGAAESNAFDTPLLQMLSQLVSSGMRKPRTYFSEPLSVKKQAWAEAN